MNKVKKFFTYKNLIFTITLCFQANVWAQTAYDLSGTATNQAWFGSAVGVTSADGSAKTAQATCGNVYMAAVCAFATAAVVSAGQMIVTNMMTADKASGAQQAFSGGEGSASTVTTPDQQKIKDQYAQALATTVAAAQKAGITVDPKAGTLTTADGKTLSSKDFASDQAMQDAGLSLDDISKIHTASDQMKKDLNKKITEIKPKDNGSLDGGGGGPKSSASVSVPEPRYNVGGVKAKAAAVNRDPAQVAGMSKNFNGEAIGVANDSLFEMMKRRYQLHEQLGSFVQPQ